MADIIRELQAGDEAAWRRLWAAYLAFYQKTVDETVYQTTFARLLSGGAGEYRCLLADDDGAPAGLAHYFFHRHCHQVADVCYLQDLFVADSARGKGLGRALIQAVYARADAKKCPIVYWTTQHFNTPARRLYDKIGKLTPFIKYQR